ADAVPIAVATRRDHLQSWVREFRRTGDRQRAPVDRVHPIRLEVAVQLARTADARHQERLVRCAPDFGHRTLECLEHAEVATARTPRRLRLDARRERLSLDLLVLCRLSDRTE